MFFDKVEMASFDGVYVTVTNLITKLWPHLETAPHLNVTRARLMTTCRHPTLPKRATKSSLYMPASFYSPPLTLTYYLLLSLLSSGTLNHPIVQCVTQWFYWNLQDMAETYSTSVYGTVWPSSEKTFLGSL